MTIITGIIRWFKLQRRIMQRLAANEQRWRNADRYWPEWTQYQPGGNVSVQLLTYSEIQCQTEECIEDYFGWLRRGGDFRFRVRWSDYPYAWGPPRVLGKYIRWMPYDQRQYLESKGVFISR